MPFQSWSTREPRKTTTCQGIGRIETSFAFTQPVRPLGRPGTAILYQAGVVLVTTFVALPGFRFAGAAILLPIARMALGR